MKQWLPLKIVLISGLFMLIQYFVPREESEFLYEYALDFIIIIGIFALALGIWSLIRVSFEKIRRKTPGWGYSWVILIGLALMLFFGFWPFRSGNIGDTPSAVAIGDIDFDQDNDLVVANYDSDNISIFKNRGNGLYISAYTYKAGKTPKALALADLDDDNDLDIIVANETEDAISVLTNTGKPGDFISKKLQITAERKPDSLFNVGQPKFAKAVQYQAGTQPFAIARGDLDGDGRVNDVVVANRGSDNLSVFLNQGDGTFADAVNYPVGQSPVAVYVADLNADLINDLVVANEGSANISFLPGNSGGSFGAAEIYPLEGLKPTSLVTGDFDQNGYIDLAVSGSMDDAYYLNILKSDSTGMFAAMESFETGDVPVSLAAADLDQDGYRDLAAACQAENALRIHKNDGLGNFTENKKMFAGRTPVAVITGMLDKSGRPALVVANHESNNVATISNRGGFDFEPGVSLQSGDFLFLGGGLSNYFYVSFFDNVMIPIQATMFSLLAFYIASAAYRAFRARSLLSTILLVAALIIMIRFVPLGPISDLVSNLSSWILKVPNMAAKRAIFIGVGLGMVATAIKILLGVERGYLGRD
jgi:hypothetical protein